MAVWCLSGFSARTKAYAGIKPALSFTPMRQKAPAVQARVSRSGFLACVLGLVWLIPFVFLLLCWGQGAVLTGHLFLTWAYFFVIGLGLFWFYIHLFRGEVIWNGSAWLLQTVSHPPSLITNLQPAWLGQNHFLLAVKPVQPAKSCWVWVDASMCSVHQWSALRRALVDHLVVISCKDT